MFADHKDDPTASTFALEYLRRHNELANESGPWHTHDLDEVPGKTTLPAPRETPRSPLSTVSEGTGGR